MNAFALDLNQAKTLRFGEFGVSLDHLDSEGDLVDNALTGAVAAGEEFQVFDTVVLPIAVDMVDGFFGEEIAPDMLRHDEAVLEDPLLFASNPGRDRDDHVAAAFFVTVKPFSCRQRSIEASKRGGTLVSAFAFVAAKFLLRVVLGVPGAPFVSTPRNFFSTLKARKDLLCGGILPAAYAGAFAAAIHRVVGVLFPVLGEETRLNSERLSARFAVEFDARNAFSDAAIDTLVFVAAGLCTEFFAVFARFYEKVYAAAEAGFLNGHGGLLVDEKRTVSVSVI